AALLDVLLRLPPPVPPCDGGHADALVAMTLAKQWASSRAAFAGALRRMLVRGAAIRSALESGTHPSARELARWLTPEGDAVQLAFAALLSPSAPDATSLLDSLGAHESAVRALLARVRGDASAVDDRRAEALRAVRRAHPGASIVAFSAYTDTVRALFARLRTDVGIAALTARGALVAGGRLSRAEALARFAPLGLGVPPPRDIERITLLLTTDLSSEGVNLQDAEVVVHVDLPWTAARLEQRVGRSRRLGARHARTIVYTFAPPASAERLLALERRIRVKLGHARALVGSDVLLFGDAAHALDASATSDRERLARYLAPWLSCDADRDWPLVSAVRAPVSGALALVSRDGRPELVAIDDGGVVSTDVRAVLTLVEHAGGAECVADACSLARAGLALRQWLVAGEAAERAGASGALAPAQRLVTRAIAAAIGTTPYHRRAELAEAAGRALHAAATPMGIAGEWSLRDMARASSDRALVERLGGGLSGRAHSARPEILAVLVLSRGAHPPR
ncbi:MAG: helicase-related protein, partial [Gemmatimonadaceae bacterium]